LIHGLTDSPYFVEAIARKFFGLTDDAGQAYVSVVMPLLPAHGLKNNPGQVFRDLSYQAWRKTVDNAVDVASELGDRISIGGLSTGGSLSVDKVLRDQAEGGRISGGVFLFSAALQIAKYERLLNTFLGQKIAKVSDEKRLYWDPGFGIGDHPYRYSYVFQQGADELNKLNNEILGDQKNEAARLASVRQPAFVVHSQDDQAADINRVKAFYENHRGPKDCMWLTNVAHASVVLESPIKKEGTAETLEEANPRFDEMMRNCIQFFETHVAKV
jgi:esterase/lipase